MSSDFLWRPFDVSKFGLIYAGAQKNIGPSGVVVVVVSKELVEQGRKDIPKIFQFRTHAENKSLYNTPPTFGIYLVRNVLAWLKGLGGLAAMEKMQPEEGGAPLRRHRRQPRLFPLPGGEGEPLGHERRLPAPDRELEERFVAEAKKQGMVGLKGHRSVGGIRVSIYNAVPYEWVETLAAFMEEFARAK